ncbi:MAG: hypothetical protein HDT42_04100 [Ruminococcaceae bacterium]|nr:hypothetical protein [Oscillospiraceae bacterium]
MEKQNTKRRLKKAVKRFSDLTAREICDKIAEFVTANDNDSFIEAKLALSDRIDSMSDEEISDVEDYSIEKRKNGFREYNYAVQIMVVKYLNRVIDEYNETHTKFGS